MLISWLREENSDLNEHSLSLSYGSENLSDEWFASNHENWGRDIYFNIHVRLHAGLHRRFLSDGIISKCLVYSHSSKIEYL